MHLDNEDLAFPPAAPGHVPPPADSVAEVQLRAWKQLGGEGAGGGAGNSLHMGRLHKVPGYLAPSVTATTAIVILGHQYAGKYR